jgi:multiple sugar transport system substrate-binding protein
VISGQQYDQVHQALRTFSTATGIEVEVAFQGDHVALNRHISSHFGAGGSYDLISTHTKYVSSQAQWLAPLDELVSPAELARLYEPALALSRVGDRLMCVPRNIDARLLFVNRDLVADDWTPTSWTSLLDSLAIVTYKTGVAGFAFPTRDSGLFGTFYELTAAFGGHLFDRDLQPLFTSAAAIGALEWLVDASRGRTVTPPDMVTAAWYFDEVSSAFRQGDVAVVGDWPGYYSLLANRPEMRRRVRVVRYPKGMDGTRHVYAGCHGWAIPVAAADMEASAALLRHLISRETAMLDAAAGMVPVCHDVAIPAEDPLDAQRAELLRATVAEDLLTFPPMPRYPDVEDAAATSLREALLGGCSIADALERAQLAAEHALRDDPTQC